jgi:PAS domain S-box-containing protein
MAEVSPTPSTDTQLFRDVFNASPIGIAVESLEGKPLFVNPALCSMLGFSEEEICTKHCVQFSPPEDAEKDWALFEQLRAGSIDHYQLEKRYFRRDGSLVWGRLSLSLLKGRSSPLVVAMVDDITDKKRAEETLRESEEKFRSVFRDAGVGMVILSPEGRFLAANGTFCDYLGYTEEELLERTVQSVTLAEDWPSVAQKLNQALATGGSLKRLEKRCLHKRGRIVCTESSASLIRSREGTPRYFVGEVLDITKRKEAEQALLTINRRLIEAQEQERTRIARDLHDDINQRLAMLAVEIEQVQQNPPGLAHEIRTALTAFRERVVEISTEVQLISHQLHLPQLEYVSIVAAMGTFCREFAERQKVEIDFRHDHIPSAVSHDISLCFFRVLQEALHNAKKHSQVRHFEVVLGYSLDQLHLTVTDHGTGFDTQAALSRGGLGLISMRERVRLVNGTFAIDSKPMRGTSIHVCVPLASERGSKRVAV